MAVESHPKMPFAVALKKVRSRNIGLFDRLFAPILLASSVGFAALPAAAETEQYSFGNQSVFGESLLSAAGNHTVLRSWYSETGFASLWTAEKDITRRAAFFAALSKAPDHGLPVARYDAMGLKAAFASAQTQEDLARLEIEMSKVYLRFVKDLTSGMITPHKLDPTIVREITQLDPTHLLARIASEEPAMVLADLAPKSPVYARLVKEKITLQEAMDRDAWGAGVPMGKYEAGQSGGAILALRDRLVAMGYLAPTVSIEFDAAMTEAVKKFQTRHGLESDGVAGSATLTELNKTPEDRLRSVLVAMERERWIDEIDLSGRMIWVNIPDYTAKIIDDGQVTFATRAVMGAVDLKRRTPEFSDAMAHMVVNPSWHVPRSIVVGEYLPQLQNNPNAVSHIDVIDAKGRVVERGSVDFNSFTARSFPFGMRQQPGDSNALGKVKFMFPNVHNIYLHDTPSKSLFAHQTRAYSHGCIRLADPFDFAHALFLLQAPAIEAEFDRVLKTGKETTVRLEKTIPIHLVYYTAYPEADGHMGYRRDIYGRDELIWQAMAEAGVALGSLTH